MTATKYLIVNADDFGQSEGVNQGIMAAHEHGIVTSASLMTRWPAAAEAAAYAQHRPHLSLGLHVDICEWAYRNEQWVLLYEVIPLSDSIAVADEVWRQLETFRRLVGRDPTHIDSHQHLHLREPLKTVLTRVADDLAVPLRHMSPGVSYCGNFYGQTEQGLPLPAAISVNGLLRTLVNLVPGLTELGCHPGNGDDLDTMYRSERIQEVNVLCDPRVRAAIAVLGIELCSFHDFPVYGVKPTAREGMA